MLSFFKLLIGQSAFLVMQFALLINLNYFYGFEASGQYFYYLAILSPAFLFFSFGARQLYLSKVINDDSHLSIRVLGMSLFLVFSILFSFTISYEHVPIIIAILFFKIYENIQDYKIAKCLVYNQYQKILIFQACRLVLFLILIFTLPLWIRQWELTLLLTSSFMLLISINFCVIKAPEIQSTKKAVFLGGSSLLVALVASVPKIKLESYISIELFGALQTFIYIYIFWQLVVNVVTSKLSVKLAMYERSDIFRWINIYCLLLFFFTACSFIIAYLNIDIIFMMLTSEEIPLDLEDKVHWVFVFLFISLLGSYFERFSSLFGAEKEQSKIYFFLLIICVMLSYILIPKYEIMGYLYSVIFLSFLKVLLLNLKYYHVLRI